MPAHERPRPGGWRPEAKVTAAGVTGAAVTVLTYLATLFGLDLPGGVAEAVVALAAAAAGWLAPHTRRDDVEGE